MGGARRAVLVVFAFVGCGGDDAPSSPIDATIFPGDDMLFATDAPPQGACDYTETADATNDLVSTAEATNLTFGTRITLCGAIDNGHFANGTVDADAFRITIATETDVLIHMTGTGLAGPDQTVLQIRQMGNFFGFGVVEGDHGTLAAHLPPGDYVIATAAFAGSDLAAPIAYQLTVVADAPATRCAKLTTGGYVEANDGAGDGNDVISYDAGADPSSSLTASATDAPEPTGITAEPGNRYRITGSSAAVDPADDYEDRDTFAFTTGATTTQLSVRLNWTSTTVDFDYRVYPETTSGDPLSIAGGLDESPAEEEFETFAVRPNTTYWLWVAAYDGATGQPTAYEATLCAETFAP